MRPFKFVKHQSFVCKKKKRTLANKHLSESRPRPLFLKMLYKKFIPDCFWSLVIKRPSDAWSAFIVRCGCLSMCFRDNKELHILEHEILKSSSKVKVFLHFLMMFDFVSNHWNFAFCLVTYDRNNKRSGVFLKVFR